MGRPNAYDLQFLESSENVKGVISRTLGREPNTDISRGVATYIQQGRMFFESASDVPMEIRPLPLYYGMMAFAKAIIAGRGLRSPSSLCQKHGLHDKTLPKAKLADLTVKIEGAGTFQEFNDVICKHEGIDYYENSMSRRYLLKTADAAQLAGTQLTLRDILSHIGSLGDAFKITFGEPTEAIPFSLFNHGRPSDATDLRIDVPLIFEGRESLQQIIENVRTKYPMLRRWSFSSASKAWDATVLNFINAQPNDTEFSPEHLVFDEDGRHAHASAGNQTLIDFRSLLDPTCSGLTQSFPYLNSKINDIHISDTSLQYMGMFLLGSLVRYQPQIWVHSVSRFANHERPADDQALALIKRFMDIVQTTLPELVVRLLTEV